MSSELDQLEVIVLETLSFFQEMSLEEILLQMDKRKIEALPQLTIDQLKEMLDSMRKQRRIVRTKRKVDGKSIFVWRRRFVRARPWWKRIFSL